MCSGGPGLCGGTTISVTDIWPPVSSLRSRTLVRTFSADIGWAPPWSGFERPCSGAGGLEELDRVAGGVLEQDLPAARPADDVVAEGQARGSEPVALGRDVLDDEVDAVPAAGLRGAAVGHRSPGRALGTAEQQPQVPADDVGERRGGAHVEREAEVRGVEVDGRFDVVDHVADVHELVRHVRSPPDWWRWRGVRWPG